MSQKQSCVRYVGLATALGALVGSTLPQAALAEAIPLPARLALDQATRFYSYYPSQPYYRQYDDGAATADGLGAYEYYQGNEGRGAALWTQATGAHLIYGPVLETWASLGAEGGLGYPTQDEQRTDDIGRVGRFARVDASGLGARSAIVYHPDFGSHPITGPVHDLWSTQPTLLYPLDDEHDVSAEEAGRCAAGDRAQSFFTFQPAGESVVCWNAESGARLVQGAAATRNVSQDVAVAIDWEYRRTSPELQRDYLGWPATTYPQTTADGVGGAQYYKPAAVGRGALLWNPVTGAGIVYGPVLERWQALGAERGLGYPMGTSRIAAGAADIGQFAKIKDGAIASRSAIVSDPESGTHVVRGPIYELWNAQKPFEIGLIPTTDERELQNWEPSGKPCPAGDRAQWFLAVTSGQRSVICWNSQDRARLIQL